MGYKKLVADIICRQSWHRNVCCRHIATITIAFASFIGVMVGELHMADRWALKNLKGRIYTSAIGLALMIPSLVLMGFGTSFTAAIAAGMLFGLGYGLFDANNMPILCQFVPDRSRGTAYGMMNMSGLFIGALATNVLGSLAEKGMMGLGFACMAGALCLARYYSCLYSNPKLSIWNKHQGCRHLTTGSLIYI